MARQPQSGLPFLIRRSDSGQFSYWRILSDEIVPHFHGEINLEWSASTREMASPEIIKISLKTGDDKTARSRWGSIHAQVEAMLEQALGCIREKALDAEARKRLKKSDGLSGNEIATIAGQARHDVLAADDRAWEGPEEMTPMAQIMAKILKQNHTGRADADARAVLASQIVEQRMVKASLKSRDLVACLGQNDSCSGVAKTDSCLVGSNRQGTLSCQQKNSLSNSTSKSARG